MKATLIQELKLPDKLSPEDLLRLYKLLRFSDSHEAAHKIIMHHLRLGLSIALRYSRVSPERKPDFISEMEFALTRGVDNIKKGALDKHVGTPNVTGYLIKYIRNQLKRFYYKDRLLSVRIETYEKAKGNVIKAIFSDFNLNRARQDDLMWLKEAIQVSTKTLQEKKVIGRLMAGDSAQEIADSLGVKKQRISKIRRDVVARLREYYNDIDSGSTSGIGRSKNLNTGRMETGISRVK